MYRNVLAAVLVSGAIWAGAQGAAQSSAARQSGTVTGVESGKLTITTAGKAQVAVAVAPDATVLQLPPCGTNLKQATPATFANIGNGDRVVTGKPGDTATASRIILMKAADIESCRTKQAADWQQRGTSGLVKEVNGPMLTIAAGTKTYKVETTPTTVFRRYADDSVSFEDAKVGTLAQVQVGDQMSVRGSKNADGTEIAAEEVVTGTFENLSGLLTATDPAAGTITLKDLTTKKVVTVKVTANSTLRKLPPQAAAMVAGRSGGAAREGEGAPAGAAANAGGGRPRGGGGDLSRMLARFPSEGVADLHPGEAVMLVASQGHGGDPTAITLLSGVEQLLSAKTSDGQAITLQPWNMGSVPAEGAN